MDGGDAAAVEQVSAAEAARATPAKPITTTTAAPANTAILITLFIDDAPFIGRAGPKLGC
jgi:hypothetical protein